jgi:hypothetical protein
MRGTSEICSRTIGEIVQKYHRKRIIQRAWVVEEGAVGRGILDRRILCGDSRRERGLEGCGEVCENARQRAESSAVKIVVNPYPALLAQGN